MWSLGSKKNKKFGHIFLGGGVCEHFNVKKVVWDYQHIP